MEVIHDRQIPFLQCGELEVNLHGAGIRLGCEHSFKSNPNIPGCSILDNMGENILCEIID